MATVLQAKGECLCGAVSVVAKSMSTSMGACHCSKCRIWTGGPLLTVDCGADVQFSGEDNISVYESSEWAERGFCARCGTHLFYRLKENKQYFVPAGLFANESKLTFDHQVFIEEKPELYAFANSTRNMTGEELFARYSGD